MSPIQPRRRGVAVLTTVLVSAMLAPVTLWGATRLGGFIGNHHSPTDIRSGPVTAGFLAGTVHFTPDPPDGSDRYLFTGRIDSTLAHGWVVRGHFDGLAGTTVVVRCSPELVAGPPVTVDAGPVALCRAPVGDGAGTFTVTVELAGPGHRDTSLSSTFLPSTSLLSTSPSESSRDPSPDASVSVEVLDLATLG